jgi:hypothetical protein
MVCSEQRLQCSVLTHTAVHRHEHDLARRRRLRRKLTQAQPLRADAPRARWGGSRVRAKLGCREGRACVCVRSRWTGMRQSVRGENGRRPRSVAGGEEGVGMSFYALTCGRVSIIHSSQ